jgi:uncharacterized protein (DUF58 family)
MANKTGQVLPADVRERLSKLELNARNVVEGMMTGLHKSPYHGYSIEFAQHREYTWGDEIKHVDWKVFARSDRYYIKQYEEETNLTGLMMLDCSESMLYRSENNAVGTTKYEYGALAAASLCFLLLRQQDTAGLYIFDDDIRGQVPPSSHPMTLQSFARNIHDVEIREESKIGTLFHRIAEDIRRRGLVFIISDFFFPRKDLLKALQHLRHKRQEVVLLHVMDPDELQFPFDDNIRFDGYEIDEKVFVEPRALRDAYMEVMKEFIQDIEKCCSDTQSDYLLLDTSKPLKHVLAEYMNTFRSRR